MGGRKQKGSIRKSLLAGVMSLLLVQMLFSETSIAVGSAPADGTLAKEEVLRLACVNPIYADVITEDMLLSAGTEDSYAKDSEHPDSFGAEDAHDELSGQGYRLNDSGAVFSEINSAAVYLRGEMEKRETSVHFTISDQGMGLQDMVNAILDKAVEHTGIGAQGDYLKYQYGGWSGSFSSQTSGGVTYYSVALTLSYYSTAAQEQELDQKINDVIDSLSLEGKDLYQKFVAIYDYIAEHVTYDYDHLNDNSYLLKYSAYAAMMNGTAVCQGYANLLYRMLLQAGVDCRIIDGIGNGGAHAWNIVRMKDNYYNVDVTWDSSYLQSNIYHHWCLKCDADFEDHSRNDDYLTEGFTAAYPMGETNYVYHAADFEGGSGNVGRGDVTGDGEVNLEDQMYLARYLAGWAGYTLADEEVCDVTGDGEVNLEDQMYLARYLAGWTGYELNH